jgi:FkbM family methyltransferase
MRYELVHESFDLARRQAARVLFALGRRIAPLSAQEQRLESWHRARGDATLRLDYDLHAESVVFDLGGYMGQWTSDIFARYCCSIHVFEPVPRYADGIRARFRRNPRVQVHCFGLSAITQTVGLTVCGDASSTFLEGQERQDIRLVSAREFLASSGIRHVDLAKINIEGGEYDLLEHLLRERLIDCFDNLQIQFHDFVPAARKRMERIQSELAATHELTYQYPFVWENWRRRAQADGVAAHPATA